MALRLHRGPAFGAASRAARAAWTDRGGLLVLRDRDAVGVALEEAAGPGGVVLDREAVTFAGLRARVRAAAGLGPEEPPSSVAVRLALQEALGSRLAWPGFGRAVDAPGLLGVLERAIAELRGARVRPAELARAAPAAGAPSADLAALYADLEGTLLLRADLEWAAADAASALDAFPPVAVDGLDDLAPAAWAMLRGLARVTDVEVAMVHEAGRPACRARSERQERWAADAAAVRDHPAEPEPGRPASLLALDAGLFEDRTGVARPPDGGAVRFVAAAGTRGMHRSGLEEVLACVDAGLAPAECALVVPRLAEARDDLDRLMDDWGIPARRATRIRFLEAPVGLALAHLLALGEMAPHEPGALDPLLGWLRTPYSGAEPDDVDRFEADMRRGGIDVRADLIGRFEDAVMAPARALVAASRAGPRAAASALAAAGWAALARLGGRSAPGRADRRDLAAVAALSGLAAEVEVTSAEDGRPRGPVPRGLVGRMLADLTVPDEEGPPDGLTVLDYAGLRGRRYRCVVLCGLDAGGMPGRPVPDPLLGPVRVALRALPPRAAGTDEHRLRFVQAVAAARERLVLVRRYADDEGREAAPSPYWVEALRVLHLPIDHADRRSGARGELADDPDRAATEREALRTLAERGRTVPGTLAGALGRRLRPVGLSGRPFAARQAFSVTGLEAYLSCNYGWLHSRVLRPQPLEQAFDYAAEGSFGHDVLQRLYAAMHAAGAGACTPGTVDRYLEILPQMIEAVADARRPPAAGRAYDAFAVRLGRHLEDLLREEAETGPRFVPTRFETPIRDAQMVAGATITGFADRVDLSPAGDWALAIDYKRSRTDWREEDLRLQLPLYAEASARAAGARSAGGVYVGIARRRVEGRVRDDADWAAAPPADVAMVPPAEWERLVAEALAAAAGAIAAIRAGRLEPPTGDCDSRYCGHPDLWR